MYKIIKIGQQEYKFEFSIEASLYDDCVEGIINYYKNLAMAQVANVVSENASEEEQEKIYNRAIKEGISAITNLPKLALTLWYAGFMEQNGDKVKSFNEAKRLYKVYASEHPEESSLYDIIALCMAQMEEDGFFHLIGLDKMFAQETPAPKTQDHKRKSSKASAK